MADSFLHGIEVVDVDDGVRTITTASSSVIGIVGTAPQADPLVYPLNTPVVVSGSAAQLAALVSQTSQTAGEGSLPTALEDIYEQAKPVVIVIRVEQAFDEKQTLANVVGGVDAMTGKFTGTHALLAAESIVGAKPRILIAPGFTHQTGSDDENPTANPVVAELTGIAKLLRAIIIQDGPSTTDANALSGAKNSVGGERTYYVDPRVLKTDEDGNTVTSYSSAAVAGVIAYTDNTDGWWASPSNHTINGIIGTERAIPFSLGDETCNANLLNAGNVATIIRTGGDFKLWGNRTLSTDPKWQFLCVVRTNDIIAESIQAAHLWAVDKGITKTYATDVMEAVNAYLRDLKTKGAIIDGNCWMDPDLNTPQNIAQGHVYWDYDFGPSYPAERMTFRAHINNNYLTEIV